MNNRAAYGGLFLAWASLIFGCSSSGPTVKVNVKGLVDSIASLTVQTSLTDVSHKVHPATGAEPHVAEHLESFELDLPAGTRGTLAITVEGADTSGCARGSGSATIDLSTDSVVSTTVTLVAVVGCRIDVGRGGRGAGTVTWWRGDAKIDSDAACVFQSIPTPVTPGCPAPDDGGSSDPPCTETFDRAAESVTLKVAPASGSYFAGWTGQGCAGTGDCDLEVASGTLRPVANFLPRFDCSSDGLCWQHPLPQGNPVQAIYGFGGDDVWAAGDHGLVLHWNGQFWSRIDSITGRTLLGVWGSSSDDLWFVGYDALHLVGGVWSCGALPAGAATHAVRAISGSSAADVWAAGDGGTLYHYDGSQWTQSDSGTTKDLFGITVPSPGLVLLAGASGTALLCQSGVCKALSLPEARGINLNAVYAVGATEAYFVGDGGTIVHWGGLAVAAVTTQNLRAVYGVQGVVHIVGDAGTVVFTNGNLWTTQDSGTPLDLHAVWMDSPNDVWAGGAGGAIQRYTGAYWTSTVLSDTASAVKSLWGSPGTAMPPTPPSLWALTSEGTLLRSDGNSWFVDPRLAAATTGTFTTLTGVTSSEVWAAGSDGMAHWDGSAWTFLQPGDLGQITFHALNALSIGTDRWVADDSGIAYDVSAHPTRRYDCGENILGLYATLDRYAYAVGEHGGLFQLDSITGMFKKWTGTPAASRLDGVAGVTARSGQRPTDAWAVGAVSGDGGTGGAIYHFDGTTLAQVYTCPKELRAIAFASSGDGWAAGDGGTVLRYDHASTKWSAVDSNTHAQLWTVGVSSDGKFAYVAGASGAILKYSAP